MMSMLEKLSHLLDSISDFLAQRKGLLPIIGLLFVIVNAVIQFLPAPTWLISSNLFLHIGIVIAIVGILVAWAL
jgi:TRAP-type mannitol/chloroaromatic compound transport system permease small subunit